MKINLKSDYRYCKKVTRINSKSFYAAFSCLPKIKAEAVYAVYAFCRAVDDAVDMESDVERAKENLNALSKNLDRVYQGDVPESNGWLAFSDTVKKWDIPKKPFEEQIKGQLYDLEFKPFENLEELYKYCDCVAGSVGRMLLPILATKNRAILNDSAGKIGVAMQLTNILRDVGEDLRDRDRVYLPQDRIKFYKIDINDLRNSLINDNFISLWEELAKKSEELYEEGLNTISKFDSDSIKPLFLSVVIYRGIHQAVRKNEYDCLSKRNFVTKKEMKQIVVESSNLLDIKKGVLNE